MTYYLQKMQHAYIDAALFTDTPEDADEMTLDLTREFETQAYSACYHFEKACDALGINIRDLYPDPSQLGHDLWLTRNGHGTGFWDRPPEMYGENDDKFTAIAEAMGEHYAEFVE